MGDKLRHKRLRSLITKLNRQRKKQARQIDILCNDFISAQRNFIKNLKTTSFMANFYESIIGATDLNDLLCTAVGLIKEEHDDANVVAVGSRVIGVRVAEEIVDAFLSATFSGEERHVRRLAKVKALEDHFGSSST